jgi:hypothetical protein
MRRKPEDEAKVLTVLRLNTKAKVLGQLAEQCRISVFDIYDTVQGLAKLGLVIAIPVEDGTTKYAVDVSLTDKGRGPVKVAPQEPPPPPVKVTSKDESLLEAIRLRVEKGVPATIEWIVERFACSPRQARLWTKKLEDVGLLDSGYFKYPDQPFVYSYHHTED